MSYRIANYLGSSNIAGKMPSLPRDLKGEILLIAHETLSDVKNSLVHLTGSPSRNMLEGICCTVAGFITGKFSFLQSLYFSNFL